MIEVACLRNENLQAFRAKGKPGRKNFLAWAVEQLLVTCVLISKVHLRLRTVMSIFRDLPGLAVNWTPIHSGPGISFTIEAAAHGAGAGWRADQLLLCPPQPQHPNLKPQRPNLKPQRPPSASLHHPRIIGESCNYEERVIGQSCSYEVVCCDHELSLERDNHPSQSYAILGLGTFE
jgi:hypothetical protein